MPNSTYCPTCRQQCSEGAAFCSSCDNPRFSAPAVDQSNNNGGTNMHAGRDIHLGDQERWDTRAKTVMDRDHKRPIWPADWVSAISGIMTIASFLGVGQLPGLTIPLTLIGIAFGTVTFLAFTAGNDLRAHGSHVLPLGLGTLERAKNGSIWLTNPVTDCPWCPGHRPGTMHVKRTPGGPQWVCTNSPSHHGGWDGTQMPDLLADESEAA